MLRGIEWMLAVSVLASWPGQVIYAVLMAWPGGSMLDPANWWWLAAAGLVYPNCVVFMVFVAAFGLWRRIRKDKLAAGKLLLIGGIVPMIFAVILGAISGDIYVAVVLGFDVGTFAVPMAIIGAWFLSDHLLDRA